MNSPQKNSLKKLMLIALVLCMPLMAIFSIENKATAPAATLSLSQVYNFSAQAGTAQSQGWDATKVRNFAYKEGKLYLVYNQNSIKVIDAQTGSFLYDLNITGVTGGYFTLCDIGVFDGKVVASNLKVTGASTPLKVYIWDNDQSAPRTVLTTYDYGSADRIGDVMSFYGTLNDGEILFARDNETTTRIISYKVTNGIASTIPTVVYATTNGSGHLQCGLSVRVLKDANGYWINGTTNQLTRLDTSGERLYTVPESSDGGNSFSAFVFEGRQYALLDTYVGGMDLAGGAMNLVDANLGWQYVDVLGTYPLAGLGSTPNTNGTGGVISRAGSNYVQAWVLSSQQGLAYFKYGTPPNSGGDPGTQYPTELTTSHLFTSSYTWDSNNKVRDIAYHNGRVYAIENNESSSAIHAINGSTGTEITSEKVTNEWFNAFSISNDGAGNLYVPTGNSGGVSSFMLSKLSLPNTVSQVNNHIAIGSTIRTDFIAANKVTDNTTYIAGASVANSPRVVRVWTANQLGMVSLPKTFSLPSGDNNGTGGEVKWINANKILLTGSSKVPAILTLNMSSETYTKTEVNTSAVSFGGAAYFKVYGYPYVALPTNGLGSFKVLEIANPAAPVQVTAITTDIGATTNGAAHVGMEAVVDDNEATIYVWSPNNGLAAYKLAFPYRDTNPNEEDDPVIPEDPEEDEDEDDGTLQREMRATWLAQVGVDWPTSKATNASGRAAQQTELTNYLDQLHAANCNAVYFHIRSMADRSYALSSTADVPWSSYLTGTRGSDPGYDPLRFAIDEAHKRGMELHGWMNPYRFPTNTTVPSAMSSWVFTYASGKKILNPGIPAVRQHIADATRDVVQNYPDIDGIVWDDYFYEDGTTDAMDQAAFTSYNPKGLSRGDWRRDNINQTIELVYNTIQSVNPGIRFGISPRGIWGIKQSDANQHGVTLPSGITGADNYNGIYTDGIAWLRYGIIDYISPQLYWATYPTGASGQDYNVLAPWWQSVADMFNRHFYSSIGLYRGFSESEIGREIAKNREVNYKSPGSVFFSTKNFTSYNSYITNNYFQNQILPPAITWKAGSVKPNRVDNVVLNGTTLSWTSDLADGSYAIFAVPKSLGVVSIKHCNYMIHRVWTNNKSFALGSFASLAGTHNFAVAAVNRYNMMSEPKFESYLTTEVEKVENTPAFKIYSNHAGLNIELEQAEQVNIFSLSGVLQYQGYVENTLTINLPQGVYLVKIGSKTVKVVR